MRPVFVSYLSDLDVKNLKIVLSQLKNPMILIMIAKLFPVLNLSSYMILNFQFLFFTMRPDLFILMSSLNPLPDPISLLR